MGCSDLLLWWPARRSCITQEEKARRRGGRAEEKARRRGERAEEKARRRGERAEEKARRRGERAEEKARRRGERAEEKGMNDMLLGRRPIPPGALVDRPWPSRDHLDGQVLWRKHMGNPARRTGGNAVKSVALLRNRHPHPHHHHHHHLPFDQSQYRKQRRLQG